MPINNYPHVTRTTRQVTNGAYRYPRPPWPDGARCVVCLTVDFDGPSFEVGNGFEPLGIHSSGRYSARRGIPRLLKLFDEEGVKAGFYIPGYDAECYPEIVREIVAKGHAVDAHGYLHEMSLKPPEEEKRRLQLTHDILTSLTGKAPVGWRSPGGMKTSNTLKVLRGMGYVYDTSDKDADAPYVIRFDDGRTMVEFPNNTFSLDDFPFYHHSQTPVSEVLEQWIAEFEAIYAERGYYMLTFHPRGSWGSGTANRAQAIGKLIRHMKRHSEVAFVTLPELTQWVTAHSEAFEEVRV
jgi:peptidoglycan/xylan/chitin deacetylase (PgdA/CDA1 family)